MLPIIITQASTTVSIIWPLLLPALIFLCSLTLSVTVIQMTGPVGRGLCAGWSETGIMEGMMKKLRLLLLHFLHFSSEWD